MQDWLLGATNDAMVRLGLLAGEAPPADLLLSVNVEKLHSVIAALGEVREVLMAVPVGATSGVYQVESG